MKGGRIRKRVLRGYLCRVFRLPLCGCVASRDIEFTRLLFRLGMWVMVITLLGIS